MQPYQPQTINVPVCKPYLWENEIRYVNEALHEGWISSKGRFINDFENKFASFCKSRYAVTVSNATNALHLAIDVLGLGDGDEIIIPDFTMMAPVFAILQNRCIPVFVDIDETWNMDVDQIESKISKKTKAILVVHNYGHPAYMPAIKRICDKYGLLLIEDCSEAIGAEVDGEFIGNWGDISCYSFYANKIITTGEGGMITTNDPKTFELVKSKKNMAFGTEQFRFEHTAVGYNYRMTNIQAAIGLGQLEYVDHAIAKKIQIANLYMHHLNGVPGVIFPPNKPWAKNVYWVFGILITEAFGCSMAHLQSILSAQGIETRNFFTPAHKQPFLKGLAIKGEFPNSTFIHLHGLYLPSFVELKDSEVEDICNIIKDTQQGLNR